MIHASALQCEDEVDGFLLKRVGIDGYSSDQIAYHLVVMGEAGLVEVMDMSTSDGREVLVTRLTWAGHEFLDTAREAGRWNQTKELIAKVGGASIAVWTAVLTDLVKRNLGLSP